MKNIKSWYKYKGQYIISDFIRGIKNIIIYFNVIYKTREWDYGYTLELLEFKLRRQAKAIKNGYASNSERTSEIILLCANLCNKVKEQDYQMEYLDYCEDEFEWIKLEDKPGYSELKINPISDRFQEYFDKHKSVYRYVIKNKGASFIKLNDLTDTKKIAMAIAHYNHDRARKLLFKILEQHIEGFWD